MPSRPRLAEDPSPGRVTPERVETPRSSRASKRPWLERLFARSLVEHPSPPSAPASDPLLAFTSETSAARDHGSARQMARLTPGWPPSGGLVLVAVCGIVLLAGTLAFGPAQR